MSLESIAEAVWAYETRTLASGTPDEPTTRAEEIAEALWAYETRTLTDESEAPVQSWWWWP